MVKENILMTLVMIEKENKLEVHINSMIFITPVSYSFKGT